MYQRGSNYRASLAPSRDAKIRSVPFAPSLPPSLFPSIGVGAAFFFLRFQDLPRVKTLSSGVLPRGVYPPCTRLSLSLPLPFPYGVASPLAELAAGMHDKIRRRPIRPRGLLREARACNAPLETFSGAIVPGRIRNEGEIKDFTTRGVTWHERRIIGTGNWVLHEYRD